MTHSPCMNVLFSFFFSPSLFSSPCVRSVDVFFFPRAEKLHPSRSLRQQLWRSMAVDVKDLKMRKNEPQKRATNAEKCAKTRSAIMSSKCNDAQKCGKKWSAMISHKRIKSLPALGHRHLCAREIKSMSEQSRAIYRKSHERKNHIERSPALFTARPRVYSSFSSFLHVFPPPL